MWIQYNGCEETEQHICDRRRHGKAELLILKHDVHIYLYAVDTKTRYDKEVIRACPYCGESFEDFC